MTRAGTGRVRAWMLGQEPLYSLVALRVILGGCLAGAYLVRLPFYASFYGADSIAWFPLYRSYVEAYWSPPHEWAVRLVQAAGLESFVWIAYAVLLVASVCFSVGFRTRTAGVLALVLHQFFWTLNQDTMWGWPMMLAGFAVYVVLSRAGEHFSVDAWLSGRSAEPLPWLAPAWPLRLLQLNVCTMYAVAGMSRLDNYDWHEGRMLMDALTNLLYARFVVDWTPVAPVFRALTYGVFVLEPLAPFLLWVRPVGKWIALTLIAMHVVLELMTDIGWWNWVMIGALLSFLPPEWLESAFARLTGAPRGAAEPAPANAR